MSESSAARRCPPERHPPRIDARLAASMGQCRAQVGTLRLHVDDLPRGSTALAQVVVIERERSKEGASEALGEVAGSSRERPRTRGRTRARSPRR